MKTAGTAFMRNFRNVTVGITIFLTLLFGPPLPLAADKLPKGTVIEHDEKRNLITIRPDVTGTMRTGQTIIVYSKDRKQKIGPARIRRVYHTKVIAEPEGPSWVNFRSRRNDPVATADVPFSMIEEKEQARLRLSFRDTLAPGRRWKVEVIYEGKTCAEGERKQIRSLPISNWIGFRREGDDYYQTLPAREVKSVYLNRRGARLSAALLVTTRAERLNITEVMIRSAFTRLDPPASCANEDQSVRIDLMEPGQELKYDPDAIVFQVKPSDLGGNPGAADSSGSRPALLFQIRSNGEFIHEFALTADDWKNESLSLPVPGCYFAPGMNRLEFTIIASRIVSGDLFEAGERRIIATQERTISAEQLPDSIVVKPE
jgi:hypothetical protein